MKKTFLLLTCFWGIASANVPPTMPKSSYSIKEFKQNGYVKLHEPYAYTLLNLDKKDIIGEQDERYACDIKATRCLKYDAMVPGGFHKDEGWTAYKIFFEYEGLRCSFEHWDLSLSGGYGNKDDRFYMASGDEQGILYHLAFGNEYIINSLYCATEKLDLSVKGKMNLIADKLENCKK